jgi:uncharacterized membrane protein
LIQHFIYTLISFLISTIVVVVILIIVVIIVVVVIIIVVTVGEEGSRVGESGRIKIRVGLQSLGQILGKLF